MHVVHGLAVVNDEGVLAGGAGGLEGDEFPLVHLAKVAFVFEPGLEFALLKTLVADKIVEIGHHFRLRDHGKIGDFTGLDVDALILLPIKV